MRGAELQPKTRCVSARTTQGLTPPHIYEGSVATATNNVHLASARRRSPGQGTGTWISEEPQMTLTYRGQKYDQQKVAGASARKSCSDLPRRFLRQVIKCLIRPQAPAFGTGGFFLICTSQRRRRSQNGDGLGS